MIIFPAIDLLDRKTVRLNNGVRNSAKIYGDALDFAKYFEDCGASWLHIVNLNAAFLESDESNNDVIESIASKTNLKLQIGGGIRDEQKIKRYFNLGAKRIILGSKALQDPEFAKEMAQLYSVAIGIDAKDEKVLIHGWIQKSELNAYDFAQIFLDSKIEAIICTDVSRDGLEKGLNLEFTDNIAKYSKIFTIASGGFKNEQDLIELKEQSKFNKYLGGVIVGRSFYEKNIDFRKVKFYF